MGKIVVIEQGLREEAYPLLVIARSTKDAEGKPTPLRPLLIGPSYLRRHCPARAIAQRNAGGHGVGPKRERLLDQLEPMVSRWAAAEDQDARTGRHGVKSWIAVMRPIQASI
jgi:hypothetical protein